MEPRIVYKQSELASGYFMSLISRPTKDLADFPHAARDVVLLDSVPHRDTDIPLEPLAQVEPLIIVALDRQVENPLDTQ